MLVFGCVVCGVTSFGRFCVWFTVLLVGFLVGFDFVIVGFGFCLGSIPLVGVLFVF